MWEGEESLNPFWAVRRAEEKEVQKGLQINCRFTATQSTHVEILPSGGQSFSMTTIVAISVLSNCEDILEGDELVLEPLPAKPKKPAAARGWKQQQQAHARKKAKIAMAAASSDVSKSAHSIPIKAAKSLEV